MESLDEGYVKFFVLFLQFSSDMEKIGHLKSHRILTRIQKFDKDHCSYYNNKKTPDKHSEGPCA